MNLRWKPIVLAGALVVSLGACSAIQSALTATGNFLSGTNVAQDVANACADAQSVLGSAQANLHGGALNTANSIGAYITAGCGTAESIAQIAQNSGTVEWLGQMVGQLSALITGSSSPA